MTEQPTVKEPAGMEPTQTSESAGDDIAKKLAELEIDSPQRLENMARASSEAGRLAKMVGDLRDQNEQLSRKLDGLTQYQPNQDFDYSQPGIDLGQEIRKNTRAEIQAILKEQEDAKRQATEAYYKDMSKIQGDKRYKVLDPVWQRHIQKPSVQMALQRGETNIVDEYYKVKDAYFDILEETYTNKVKSVTEKPSAPHMESGNTQFEQVPSVDPTSKSELSKRVSPDKGWTGTDEDIKEMFGSMFDKDDPFVKTSF